MYIERRQKGFDMKAKLLLGLMVTVGLVGCGGDLANVKCHYKTTVIEVGKCAGGDGFFDGNRECPISYKQENSSAKRFGKVYNGAMSGQPLYRHCWKEDSGSLSCFATQNIRLRDSYTDSCLDI